MAHKRGNVEQRLSNLEHKIMGLINELAASKRHPQPLSKQETLSKEKILLSSINSKSIQRIINSLKSK